MKYEGLLQEYEKTQEAVVRQMNVTGVGRLETEEEILEVAVKLTSNPKTKELPCLQKPQ
jgi:hypothetical protein